jgi:hypothetical protein
MLGTVAFGLVSGVVGFAVIAFSLCSWLSPWRRLRALDKTMEKAIRMFAVVQDEHATLDHTLLLRAHQQLYGCVRSRVMSPVIVLTKKNPASARQQAACFRLQLLSLGSLWSTALAMFSSLPLDITKVRRQVQSVLDELQVSDDGTLRKKTLSSHIFIIA